MSNRSRLDAVVLKDMLIQKIVVEQLSGEMQIMMVPMDGRNFFDSDIFRGAEGGGEVSETSALMAMKAIARR